MSERLKALQKFRDLVVAEAKSNLKKMGKDTSGKLSNSIKGEVKEMPNSIGVYFEMEPYGNFQDKGVSGTDKKIRVLNTVISRVFKTDQVQDTSINGLLKRD